MFTVTSYERYSPEPSVEYYETIDDICYRWATYADVVIENVCELNDGDCVQFMYDSYTTLEVCRGD